jgi:hypothetical protein
MKKIVLALLLGFILEHAPWRLVAITPQVLFTHPGPLQTSQRDDRYWDAITLEARIVDLGYTVTYTKKPIIGWGIPVWGVTDKREHTVVIDSDLHWNDRLYILSHEAAHILQPEWLDASEGEAFAESVAWIVTGDHYREHVRYLSRAKLEFLLMSITSWQQIYHAAAVLEDR